MYCSADHRLDYDAHKIQYMNMLVRANNTKTGFKSFGQSQKASVFTFKINYTMQTLQIQQHGVTFSFHNSAQFYSLQGIKNTIENMTEIVYNDEIV